MNKIVLIAKKEFQDLVNSPAMIVIMIVYALFMIGSFFEFKREIGFNAYLFWMSTANLCNILVSYGSLVAIVIGFVSINSEINSHALNTLLEKPVYRDTIINGKLIGIVGFLACVYLFTLIVILVLYFLFLPGFANDFGLFLSSLPAVIFFALLCSVFYLALTMFLSIAIKNHVLALMASLLVWIILTTILPNGVFGYSIADVLNQLVGTSLQTNVSAINNFIVELSPSVMGYLIFHNYVDLSVLFTSYGEDVAKMALYDFVVVVLCYIGFIRRDVQ